MLNFIKGFFYLSASIVIIASYFFVTTHFEKIENIKMEKQKNLDEYYSEEFHNAYILCFSKFENFKKIGEENIENTIKNALYDGYSKAEVEIMNSKGFKEGRKSATEYEKVRQEIE